MKNNQLLSLLILCLLSFTLPLGAQNFSQVDKVVASDREIEDEFGGSVSISGDFAIIGAELEDGAAGATNQGAAYIYERSSNGDWVQKQKLTASDASTNDRFGSAVAIYENFAVVGAWIDSHDENGNNPITNAGSAYVFERDANGTWTEVQKLDASNRAAFRFFGISVDVKNNYIIVGDQKDYAYIFKNTSGVWIEEQVITGPSGERFGESVAIDDNRCVIGAFQANEDENGNNFLSSAGAAYVYSRNSSGIWSLDQKLVASDRDAGDAFGIDVSISGNDILVGAQFEDHDENGNNYLLNSGSVYLFEKNTTSGQWNFTQKVVASNRTNGRAFGQTVSIEGNYLIVGDGTTAAHVSQRTSGVWNEINILIPSSPSTANQFGNSVDVSGDRFIVGDYVEDEDELGANPMNRAGAAYLYEAACEEMEISFTTSTTLCNGEITISATASVSGGTQPYTYYWSNNTNAATASDLDLGNHSVDVVDANGCAISGNIEITEEHFADINLTLVNSDCGRNRLDPFDAVLTYYTANLASAYKVRISGPGVSYVLVVNNFNQFNLGDIPGVQFGASYEVMISAQIFGVWTDYGSPCEIHTAKKSSVDLKLLCDYCGKANFDLSGAEIFFNTRPDADEYEIRVNGPGVSNYVFGVSGNENFFNLAQIPGIQYNSTYTIEIGAYVDGVWMGFGTPCEISTDTVPPIYYSRQSAANFNELNKTSDADVSKLNTKLKVYPNPTNGDNTFIQYKSEKSVKNSIATFSIYNANGNELYEEAIKLIDGKVTLEMNEQINFVKGIYLINVQEGNETFTQKLIVQ